ncbi:MAG: hypothetical protein AMS25_11390 [Gemmatimonas sp. SM23_52]|nr:MAG: hypothetical protein AMS25_11390 [Gemmatimonas sp. SM23_52]
MAAKRSGLSLLLFVGAALACGGDGVGPSADEVVGTWTATKVEYVSVSQPVQTIDLIAEGGTGTLAFSAAGTYLFTLEPIDTPGQVDTGAWELDGDILTMWPRGTNFEMRFDVVLSGNRLTLSGGDAQFDFDGDHEADDAKLYLVLVR